jgi:hypothetical protein
MGRPEGKRGVERRGCISDLKGRGWEGVNWILMDQGRYLQRAIVNAVMNFPIPLKDGSFLTI